MVAQRNRRQVSIRSSDWQKASQLRDKASRAHGRKVTITDTISSALVCLEGSLAKPRTLRHRSDPEEMGERFRFEVINLLGQFIARVVPERRLQKVTLHPATGQGGIASIIVHLDDQEVPLYTAGSLQIDEVVRPVQDGRFSTDFAVDLSGDEEHRPYNE